MSAFPTRPATAAMPASLHRVRAGEVFHLHLARGDCVQVDSGAFRVLSRHWLAGHWIATACRLETGELHRADAAGWVRLEAIPGEPAAFRHAVAQRPSWMWWLTRLPSFMSKRAARIA